MPVGNGKQRLKRNTRVPSVRVWYDNFIVLFPMRSIWTGDIGFGLVTIPVKLYSATQRSELDLDMLDKKDKANIKYKRVNADTGKEVDWEDIVKGFEIDGRYIILTDKDFENASPENSKRLEIITFIDENEVDSIYFERPYYIEPAKSGAKPYALLRKALQSEKKAGVCTFVLRNKEHLGLIKVREDVLILNQLRFQEEIRKSNDLDLPGNKKIPTNQLKMAKTLINDMTEDFNIANYKDEYSSKLLKYIKQKANGKEPAKSKMRVVHKRSDDLMEQLKASLKKRKKTS